MADTITKSTIRYPQIDNVIGGYTLTIPDSLLKDNRRVYVDLKTTCTGKAIGGRNAAFVKRINKGSGCDQWGEEAL